MSYVVRDSALREEASRPRVRRGRPQIRPSGLLIVCLLSALLWAALIVLIVSIF